CAYQSKVRSMTRPACVATSRTTVARTPSIILVVLVTNTRSIWVLPSLIPRYTHSVPGFSGKNGLVTNRTNFEGSSALAPGDRGAAVDPDPGDARAHVPAASAPITPSATALLTMAPPSSSARLAGA